jgi:limonene-1,2-epoxide hydrolase
MHHIRDNKRDIFFSDVEATDWSNLIKHLESGRELRIRAFQRAGFPIEHAFRLGEPLLHGKPRLTKFFVIPMRAETEMEPKELVARWVEAFNQADVEALAEMYAEDAVNHQVAEEPVVGKAAIREFFKKRFQAAKMVCVPENLFQDGEWAMLEWRDPLGLRGCGFFHVVNDKIVFQRGYWDKLSFLKMHGIE